MQVKSIALRAMITRGESHQLFNAGGRYKIKFIWIKSDTITTGYTRLRRNKLFYNIICRNISDTVDIPFRIAW
jgi:hypothetical protein